MQLIVTALNIEAQTWVDVLGLRFFSQKNRFRLYVGGEHALVITGTGKVRSAIGTTWAFTQLQDISQAINVGIAGSRSKAAELGQAFAISRLIDASTSKEFILDHIAYHSLPLRTLITCDEPQLGNTLHPIVSSYDDALVDMEMAGFLAAAQVFLPAHAIQGVKIVSDYLEASGLSQEQVVEWMDGTKSCLVDFLKALKTLQIKQVHISKEDSMLLEDISKALRLTQTQVHQLNAWAQYYLLKGSDVANFEKNLNCLKPFVCKGPASKQERNHHFEAIKHALLS